MKKRFVIAIVVVSVGLGFLIFQKSNSNKSFISTPPKTSLNRTNLPIDQPLFSVIAKNLDTPWAVAFLPDNSMLVTERKGTVLKVSTNNSFEPRVIAIINLVKEIGEGGLLGIAIHPVFPENNFVYLYYTYQNDGDNTFNRVVKMIYKNEQLESETVIVDNIPGARNHNGGRIKFGPDGYLYITTGDAQEPSQAQEVNSLAGKILRVTDEGIAVAGNPFNNLVYSYGHRNPQGIAWNRKEELYATEHGRSGLLSGLDEINRIQSGKNYGWPVIEGDKTGNGMQNPIINSGSSVTWAPAGATFVDSRLFFAGLRGQSLYEVDINSDDLVVKEHFKGEFGRIREVIFGPDDQLYITTSNRDGRGSPSEDDDMIIRINPKLL